MSFEKKYTRVLEKERERSVLQSLGELAAWDERTLMPAAALTHRGEHLALVAKLNHQALCDDELEALLSELESTNEGKDKTRPESSVLRDIRRDQRKARLVPSSLVQEIAVQVMTALGAWETAKKNRDFPHFAPALERILDLKVQEARCIAGDRQPYDVLIDEYEPGYTSVEMEKIFTELRAPLSRLAEKLDGHPKQKATLPLRGPFPRAAQEELGRRLLAAVGFDLGRGRLDPTTHPFCTGVSSQDVRLTTRYDESEMLSAFFSTLHEGGHGMYEQGLPDAHFGSPLGKAGSFGLHESQSRLWENLVGRSEPFWTFFLPVAQELLPSALKGVSLENFLVNANRVKRSLVRVESDEVTYNLHIILRFELEKELVSGNLPVSELPGAWRHWTRELLGIEPSHDGEGCLQDIHWAGGSFGYFPTYTIGNCYAAQFMAAAGRDLPSLYDDIRRGEFAPLLGWLRTKIHRHGRRYGANDLCEKATGSPLTCTPFLEYVERKYSALFP